jgi:two-component system, response regulator PdtaR
LRILIVEDNALLAFMLEQSLADAGHEPLGPVPDVESALQIISCANPQMALVDINLDGGSSGLDLASELHARSIPFFFATGQAAMAHRDGVHALGVIPKPFAPELVVALAGAMERVIDGESDVAFPNQIELFD